MENCQFRSKIKMAKNMRQTILQAYYSCCVKKAAWKSTKYSRNERILKISHGAKAVDFGKWSVLVKN